MLLSRVKTFNGRYKVKRHLGDPNYLPNLPEGHPAKLFMLTVPAFKELDRSIAAFLNNLPPHCKTPVVNGVIADPSLLTAISNAHL